MAEIVTKMEQTGRRDDRPDCTNHKVTKTERVREPNLLQPLHYPHFPQNHSDWKIYQHQGTSFMCRFLKHPLMTNEVPQTPS